MMSLVIPINAHIQSPRLQTIVPADCGEDVHWQ